MLLPFEYLSKFRTFKWRYQSEKNMIPSSFSEIDIPDYIVSKQKELSDKLDHTAEVTLIIDREIFSTFVKEIQYFYELNLLTEDEVYILKAELMCLIDDMEYVAKQGKNKGGQNVWLYLSNIDFESEYIYVKGQDFEAAFLDVYLMNSIMSTDPDVCKIHREWIDSLRKYSTLISISGELERKDFFEKQRKLIGRMLKVPVLE